MRAFHAWQERRLLAEANALVKEGNFSRASFNAQRVLEFDNQSAGATRVMADVAERNGLRQALDLRRRVAELGGNNARDLLAWVRTALRFGDATAAAKTLGMLPSSERETAEYHALRADVALLRRDAATYESELSRAVELEPANRNYQLALATLNLQSPDVSAHGKGVRELEQLQSEPLLRQDVTRRLAEDALRRGRKEAALQYARQLNASPRFSDRLLFLSALKLAGDVPTMQSTLTQLQAEASNDAAKVAALLGWMAGQKMSRQAVEWIGKLPPELLAQKTLPLAVADAFLGAGDWLGLEKFLRTNNWGPAEYLRAALMARTLRELGRPEESAQAWNEAKHQVNGHVEEIFLLAEMARKWGWEHEGLDLLWMAADDPQKADATLNTLYRYYAAKGDTAELYRVLLHLEELRPNDNAILNNIAQLSLLLGLNMERGYELAQRVHGQHPENADYTSTYAFSLFRRGENKKAVESFASVSDEALHRPQIAAYYGVILAAAGDHTRAREFLGLGAKANLLPEERALVEKAQVLVAQR